MAASALSPELAMSLQDAAMNLWEWFCQLILVYRKVVCEELFKKTSKQGCPVGLD